MCKDPCPSYHQTHDSCDENECHHGSYSASESTEPECLHVPKDDGRGRLAWITTNPSRSPFYGPVFLAIPRIRVFRRSPGYLKDISSASPQRRKREHQPVFAISSSSPIWHLSQPASFAKTRYNLAATKMSTAWVNADLSSILERQLVNLDSTNLVCRGCTRQKTFVTHSGVPTQQRLPNRLRDHDEGKKAPLRNTLREIAFHRHARSHRVPRARLF